MAILSTDAKYVPPQEFLSTGDFVWGWTKWIINGCKQASAGLGTPLFCNAD
jgi:hypothetical protein